MSNQEQAHGANLLPEIPSLVIPKTLKEANEIVSPLSKVGQAIVELESLQAQLSEDYETLAFINMQYGSQALGMANISNAQFKLKAIIENLKGI
jgi:hypothetical protein